MDNQLTMQQAYKAMLMFLEQFYIRAGKPENMKGFLGEIQLVKDNITADPAAWDDWLEVVNRIVDDERKK